MGRRGLREGQFGKGGRASFSEVFGGSMRRGLATAKHAKVDFKFTKRLDSWRLGTLQRVMLACFNNMIWAPPLIYGLAG